MDAYAKKTGVGGCRFMFDGSRVSGDDTAESIGMESGDSIDVLVEQVGGQ